MSPPQVANMIHAPLVRMTDVGKAFRTTRAVDGVSFEIQQGEIFALLGPNGAGKSTLVRMMIGMLPPDQGVIHWFDPAGKPIPLDPSWLGYLPEDRGLYRDQKVGRILEYFGQLRGMSLVESRRAAKDWAGRLALSEYLSSKLETLSKGNQQKVQVAAAVLHRPRLAFLDEPFSGLDPVNQEMMLNVIRSLRDDGTTVLLSAHQLDLVERLADRVFLLSRGRRVLDGTIQEVKASEYGGYTLSLHFEHAIPPASVHPWRDDPYVTSIVWTSEQSLQLSIHRKSDLGMWLARAMELGDVKQFRGGFLSLHEIYLRAIGNSAVSEPMLLASA